jgi:hypothetical protein
MHHTLQFIPRDCTYEIDINLKWRDFSYFIFLSFQLQNWSLMFFKPFQIWQTSWFLGSCIIKRRAYLWWAQSAHHLLIGGLGGSLPCCSKCFWTIVINTRRIHPLDFEQGQTIVVMLFWWATCCSRHHNFSSRHWIRIWWGQWHCTVRDVPLPYCIHDLSALWMSSLYYNSGELLCITEPSHEPHSTAVAQTVESLGLHWVGWLIRLNWPFMYNGVKFPMVHGFQLWGISGACTFL